MSVRILLSKLKQEQRDILIDILTINPKLSYFEFKRNKWKKDTDDDDDEEYNKTVQFYHYDQTSDILRLPYKFSHVFFKKNYNIDKIFLNMPFNFNAPLYEEQIDLYNEGLNYLLKNYTLNFCPYTGSGKTVMAIKMMSDLSKMQNIGIILILVTSTGLLSQWANSIKKYTGCDSYIITSPKFNPTQRINFIISTTGMAKHIPENWRQNIGALVLDEAHTFCAPSRVEAMLLTEPKYVIACTATFERDNGMHAVVEALTGCDRVFRISKKPFNVIKLNTGCDEEIPKTRFGDPDWVGLVKKLCANEERNNLIIDLVKLYHKTQKILVLSRRKNHVIDLYNRTKDLKISCDYMTGNKKTYNDSNVLYGTVEKLGTGFDEEAKCEDYNGIRIDLLIITISISSLSLLEQVAGRVFRATFPNIIYLIDYNEKSEKHFEKGNKWFISRNGKVSEYFTTKAIEIIRLRGAISNRSNDAIAIKQARALQQSKIIS